MQNLPMAVLESVVLWLWVWPIRRRGSFDIPLDVLARDVRWISFFLFVGLAGRFGAQTSIPASRPYEQALDLTRKAPVGGAFAVLAIAFLVWPNCGYRLTTALRWARLLPPASPEYARKLRIFWGKPTDEDLEADRLEQQAGGSGRA